MGTLGAHVRIGSLGLLVNSIVNDPKVFIEAPEIEVGQTRWSRMFYVCKHLSPTLTQGLHLTDQFALRL